jgi:hypothetical protein
MYDFSLDWMGLRFKSSRRGCKVEKVFIVLCGKV